MFKNKKGSEVIQNLIVIAVMGALAISAFGFLADSIENRNNASLGTITTNFDAAFTDASATVVPPIDTN